MSTLVSTCCVSSIASKKEIYVSPQVSVRYNYLFGAIERSINGFTPVQICAQRELRFSIDRFERSIRVFVLLPFDFEIWNSNGGNEEGRDEAADRVLRSSIFREFVRSRYVCRTYRRYRAIRFIPRDPSRTRRARVRVSLGRRAKAARRGGAAVSGRRRAQDGRTYV